MTDQKPVIREATLTLHAGAGQRDVGRPATAPPVLATSFFTHPDAVGFSANDLNEVAPTSTPAGAIRPWSCWRHGLRRTRVERRL